MSKIKKKKSVIRLIIVDVQGLAYSLVTLATINSFVGMFLLNGKHDALHSGKTWHWLHLERQQQPAAVTHLQPLQITYN